MLKLSPVPVNLDSVIRNKTHLISFFACLDSIRDLPDDYAIRKRGR